MDKIKKPFHFNGTIQASKSLMNRALLIQSYKPDLVIHGESLSDDVTLMRSGLVALLKGEAAQCGHAGTVLRFLALRAARLKGRSVLMCSERLLSRLPESLLKVLRQLGSEVEIKGNELHIWSDDWRLRGDGLWIPSDESSQFASAVLLNSWNIKFPLHFVRSSQKASDAYFQMSVELARAFGMKIEVSNLEYTIPKGQLPIGTDFTVDCDVSSAFVVAAAAAIAGEAQITNFPKTSLQPDMAFVRFFVEMGIQVKQNDQGLSLKGGKPFRGITADLRNCPDLFPVLSVLAAFATSESHFTGLGALKHKESNRLGNSIHFLRALGAKTQQILDDEMKLVPFEKIHTEALDFDPDHDHRMAMAATVARLGGFNVQIRSPEVVNKSFPDFWDIFSA